MRKVMPAAVWGVMLLGATASGQDRAATEANPTAVQEVLSGKRKEASAAWWGFDERDATKALQAAIRFGAKKVTVPKMSKPWIVGPLFLESDHEVPERKLDEFIYVRAGDYLIMCGQRGGPRPSEFKTAPHEQGINQLFV